MSSYLHLAKADLKYANFGLTQGNDEVDVNYAAYHVHQAIEKIAKGLLELQGEDIAGRRYRTHEIGFLLSCLDSDVYVPPIIAQRTFEIMRWVSEPRYNVNFRLSSQAVYEVYADTLHWLYNIIPPVKGGDPVANPQVKDGRSQDSSYKKPAEKSPNAKNYPKRYTPGKDSAAKGTSKKSKSKNKKRKSRA